MFRERLHALPRWTHFSLLLFISFLSGMLDIGHPTEYVMTTPHVYDKQTEVQGSASRSGQIRFAPSQRTAGSDKQATVPQKQQTKGEWGIATQVDEHTWTMQVQDDERMATPQEIFVALNAYRQKHGKGSLTWDAGLAAYAKNRTDYFMNIEKLDGHKGFSEYVNNEQGFQKLGFGGLGENSSYGYQLEGVHLIEWIYAGDKPHNDNQLSSDWTHVGIGVTSTATNLIFGGNKL